MLQLIIPFVAGCYVANKEFRGTCNKLFNQALNQLPGAIPAQGQEQVALPEPKPVQIEEKGETT
jgi:hypothetical protein